MAGVRRSGIGEAGGKELRFDGVSGIAYEATELPRAGSALRFFFEIRPVDIKADGRGLAIL